MNFMKFRNFVFVFVFFLMNASAHTQGYISNYDVAAMIEGCDKLPSTEDQVKCSEAQMLGFFTAEVDQEFCPVDDTTRIFNVSFMVDKFGNIDKSDCRSHLATDSCLAYFIKKAEHFADQYALSPAKLGKARIASKKSFSFSYPPPIRTDSISEADVYRAPDEMPRYVGCEQIVGSSADKHACSQSQLLRAVYSQLQYPFEARNKGIEGIVVVQFVIDTEGMITEPKIVRSIGDGCDEAVLDLMELMNEMNPPFVPGKHDGEKVKVLYTLPVKFKLQ